MSDDRKFERNARAWLELGPSAAPSARGRRGLARNRNDTTTAALRAPWRFPDRPSTLPARRGGLPLVVRGPAGLLILRSPKPQVAQTPSPTGSPDSSPISMEDLHRHVGFQLERSFRPNRQPRKPTSTRSDGGRRGRPPHQHLQRRRHQRGVNRRTGGRFPLRMEAPQFLLTHAVMGLHPGDAGTYSAHSVAQMTRP